MANILQAQRVAASQLSPPRPPVPTRQYPWGWDPPGPRRCCLNPLWGFRVDSYQQWRWGQLLLTVVATYLDEVQWPAEQGEGIS